MLTVDEAVAVADVVAKDPEASKRIDSNIDGLIPASLGLSGGLRNAGYVALGILSLGYAGDPTDEAYANRVCTGISAAAGDAVEAALKKKDARLRRVKRAGPVSRVLNGVDHTALQLDMVDGQSHVFDFHATLDADNPMLFKSVKDWLVDKNGVVLKDFTGFI